MNALFDAQKSNIAAMDISEVTGWSGARARARAMAVDERGEDSGARAASMASAAHSPRHLHKRRRLSRLLDKLAVQLRNNNHYPPPPWLMLGASDDATVPADTDVPLDLSVKAEAPPAPERDAYVCAACGQTFAVHDRLIKHVASRHRNRTPETARAYECDICRRRFARSDMLTRHARLHSGVKPYACAACGQVFSRSDHLATHQRTHTGEKPYRCPACPYAACRRDMITRHMRTHARRTPPALAAAPAPHSPPHLPATFHMDAHAAHAAHALSATKV